MNKELGKKCVKFINPNENDASMNDPFVYDPTYMGCSKNFCNYTEECKKGDFTGEKRTTRKTVPKVP